MIKVERIKCAMVNCWLIKGENGSILVDTAVSRFKDRLLNELSTQNIKLIVLTHGHADHTGNTAFLAQHLKVPVAMCKRDEPILRNIKARPLYADNFFGKLILNGTVSSMYKPTEFEVALNLCGGENLADFGVRDAEVIALPGHTAGSIGILAGGRDFIVGDAMMNMMKPTPGRIYEDEAALLESMVTIKKSGCKTIRTGHGKAFSAGDYFANL